MGVRVSVGVRVCESVGMRVSVGVRVNAEGDFVDRQQLQVVK